MTEQTPTPATKSVTSSSSKFFIQAGVGLAMMLLSALLSISGLYSDIAVLYTRDQLWLHRLPYIEYPLEYPVGIGIVSWLAAFIATEKQTYVLLTIALLILAGLGIIWIGRRFPEANLWVLVLSPALISYTALNWDLLALLPTVAALLLLRHQRDGWAGIALSLAIWTKFFPIVLIPLILIDRLVRGDWRGLLRFGVSFAVASLVINLPFALQFDGVGPRMREGWLHFFHFNQARPQEANLWALLASWGAEFSTAQINSASMLLMVLGIVLIGGMLAWAVHRNPEDAADRLATAALAMLAWWFFFNKVYSPQYSLWLIVLLALLGVPTLLSATFAIADLAWFVAILLAVAERTWQGWMHAPLLLPPLAFREALILVIIGWAIRQLLRSASANQRQATDATSPRTHRGTPTEVMTLGPGRT